MARKRKVSKHDVAIIKSNKLNKKFKVFMKNETSFGTRLVDFIAGNTSHVEYRGVDISKAVEALDLEIVKFKKSKELPRIYRRLPSFTEFFLSATNKLMK